MASDGSSMVTRIARDDPFDYREINFPDASILELARERGARERVRATTSHRKYPYRGDARFPGAVRRRAQPSWRVREIAQQIRPTSVPSGWPGAGCTVMPAGLLTTIISSSANITLISGRGHFFCNRAHPVRGRRRRRDLDAIAGTHSARGARGGTVTVTSPALIIRATASANIPAQGATR